MLKKLNINFLTLNLVIITLGVFLFNIFDIVSIHMFNIEEITFLKNYSFGFKVLRELLLLIFVVYLIYKTFQEKSLYLLVILLVLFVFIQNNIFFLYAGIHFLFFYFFIFLFYKNIQSININSIIKIIFTVFLIHLFFQLIQFFYLQELKLIISNIFEKNHYYLNPQNLLRNVGIFNKPVSAAFFSFLVFYLSYYYLDGFKKHLLLFLVIMSIFLLKSGTGVISIIAIVYILFMVKYSKYKFWLLLLTIPLMFIVYVYLGDLTNRHDLFSRSFAVRIELIKSIYQNIGYGIFNFGESGNLVWKFKSLGLIEKDLLSSDSFYAMVLVNFGKILLLIYFLSYLLLMLYCFIIEEFKLLVLLSILFLFGFTLSITEVYGVSYLFALFIAYELKKGKVIENITHYRKS